ncbi:similar to Saccharomyces cerevisiae YBR274W CHK1 Serine/threonine kinase and DNA damage checkpoint effector, mediates cell cycle arrest via phosphorylation of Pds1p [Maudiozyma saulgeensis]|uniref:non-specific serine/threonine protein kinase n=1 Tax=Maudiozyma saulgeensis TaxID=1789683 RepID=A0A1X7R112_9SACH|nr:similar to Saccharomyces cerevisiae YBR274W CHK1 Serine/threonine kinase and DNA damage checkpoint effector, mediates cell cycle arrest via phosphorylation of Pds1p [Kazachstania saulgeensis]
MDPDTTKPKLIIFNDDDDDDDEKGNDISNDTTIFPELPIINGITLDETIGQGAFGCVTSAHSTKKPSMIFAIKFIHLPTIESKGLQKNDTFNEIKLHMKCSKHPNILKLIDCQMEDQFICIFLELANGGDLFDKIEPDIGVDTEIAQFYFKQLVNAIFYLHNECGIAHRDIKPENILLDKDGNLKLADFGLASKFKRKDGSKKVSKDKRGSYPYMAPEILSSDIPLYYADVTDVWSIGILVFVLLTGEIPWEIPTKEDNNFINFIKNKGNLNLGPWSKIEFNHLNLLRKLLQPLPEQRVTINQLKLHPWYNKKINFANSSGLCNNPGLLAQKLYSNLKVSLSDESYDLFTQNVTNRDNITNFASTQPLNTDMINIKHDSSTEDNILPNTQITAFSQYIPRTTTYSMDSQLNTNDNDNRITKLEKWKTFINNDIAMLQFNPHSNIERYKTSKFNPIKLDKFYTIVDMQLLVSTLQKAFNVRNIVTKSNIVDTFEALVEEYGMDKVFPLNITIKTKDRMKSTLAGSINITQIDSDLKCLNFQRKSGDPLEWRRLFKNITLFCRDLIFMPNND